MRCLYPCGRGQLFNASADDLALALFCTSCWWVVPRDAPADLKVRRYIPQPPADTRRAVRDRASLRSLKRLLCLHALSSFQRTGSARLPLPALSWRSPPNRLSSPVLGEPFEVTTGVLPSSSPFLSGSPQKPDRAFTLGRALRPCRAGARQANVSRLRPREGDCQPRAI